MASALVSQAVAGIAPGNRRVRLDCPECDARTGKADRRQSLSFDTNTGWFKCHKCGVKGTVTGWSDAPPPDVVPAGALPVVKEVQLPEGFYLLSEEPAWSSAFARPARDYLRKRVPECLWAKLGLGATLEGQGVLANRVVVPMWDPSGRLVGWVGRSWTGAQPTYYTCPGMDRARVFYNGAVLDHLTEDPVLVVEGVFDAIHVGTDAVAVLGKPSGFQVAALAACRRPVVLALDGDTNGIAGDGEGEMLFLRLQFARAEEGKRTGILRLPPATDPDEIPADKLKRLARSSLEGEVTWV